MRYLPEELVRHLSGEATTLCRCWLLRRRDGAMLGFTDHDRDLEFAGVSFEAAAGVSASELESSADLAADTTEIAGALNSQRISEADIAAGRYDHAAVEVWLVNWQDADQRVLEHRFAIGSITCEDGAYRAELRSLAARLDQRQGRSFSRDCDADFGDARCGANAQGQWSRAAIVTRFDGRRHLEVECATPVAPGLFRGGRLRKEGVGAGETGWTIAEHAGREGREVLAFWQEPSFALAPGDGVTLTAGCDKRFETCRDRFANWINFRGFPHMPGNDPVLGYASSFDIMDGGVLVP